MDSARIRSLVCEAMDSVKRAYVLAGEDPRIGFMLFKWPDVILSVVDFADGKISAEDVIRDVNVLICEPLLTSAEALVERHGDSNQAARFKTIRDASKTSPLLAKRDLIILIEELRK